MSHVVAIKTAFNDAEALRSAFDALGFDVSEAESYRWWGYSVGDYPVPEGFTAAELGRCHFKATQRGATSGGYEAGIIDKEQLPANHPARSAYPGRYIVQYDFFDQTLAKKLGSEGAPHLCQRYAVEVARAQLRRKGYQLTEERQPDGRIRVVGRKR